MKILHLDHNCEEHYEPFGQNQCARLETNKAVWEDAVAQCKKEGSKLLSIVSEEVQVSKCFP